MEVIRSIFKDLTGELSRPQVLILIGARQVGKTFLMGKLQDYLKSKGKKAKYFNLEIPRDSRLFAGDLIELYEEITRNVDFIFIDEFHYFENASRFFKAIFDDKKLEIKIIASGSSSLQMHKHLKESLAGRKVEKIIYPLSYNEFRQSGRSFYEYLLYGGLPGLLELKKNNEKIDLLANLTETYILKDVKALIKEENVSAFNKLLYLLADRQGQIISVSSLANELRLDNKTIGSYLDILELTFIIYSLPSYSKNLSNELKKSKKYYLYDIGIRNSLLNDFKELIYRNDKGLIYETYVNNYIRSQAPKNSELRFWRTKKGDEMDFVYLKNRNPFVIEVKSKLQDTDIPSSILKFVSSYKNTQGVFIVNENIEKIVEYNKLKIDFVKLENLEFNERFNLIFRN